MDLKLGTKFPNFAAKTTVGEIDFHNWIGNSWAILFSHPADYTPVCTTELAEVVKLMPEFEKRSVKVIALSCDSVESHQGWSKDILHVSKTNLKELPYPIIADEERNLAAKLMMIDEDERDANGIPLTARAVFVIDPVKKFRLSILYPATTGRNFNEILRVIDSMQLTDKSKVATPVNWQQGDPVMVLPTIPISEEKNLYPKGVEREFLPSEKDYFRKTPQP